MLGDKESGLKLYSLGIVVNDKLRDSDIIDVYPVEDMPFINGKIKDYKQSVTGNVNDSKGVSKPLNIDMGAVIKAKWIPYGGSNRSSSPDVTKNETVLVFRFGETNKFYWTTVFNEPSIRRLETVVHRYGATSEYGVELDDSNSYTLIVSAHDRFIRLTTSNKNKEVVKYQLLLDLNKGTIGINDDQQNDIIIDSIKGIMTVTIREKVITNTKDFIVNASNSIQLNTKNYTLKTDTGTVNASSYTLNASNSKFNGNSLVVSYSSTVFNGSSLSIGTSSFNASAGVSHLNASTSIRAQSASTADCC